MEKKTSVFTELLSALRGTTSTIFKKHKDSNAINFIKSSIERAEKILKIIDKFLKKKGINVAASAKYVKNKVKDIAELSKGLYEEGKKKNFIKVARDKVTILKSKLTNVFKKENETVLSPPVTISSTDDSSKIQAINESTESKLGLLSINQNEIFRRFEEEAKREEKDAKEVLKSDAQIKEDNKSTLSRISGIFGIYNNVVKSLKEKIKEKRKAFKERSLAKALKEKGLDDDSKANLLAKFILKADKVDSEEEKKDESKEAKEQKRKSFFSRIFSKDKERADKRKKEIEEEKKAVQERMKKNKGKKSWLSKILLAIGKVGSFISKSIFGLGSFLLKGFGKLIGFLGGFVVKGLSKTITSLIPGISSKIAKITSNLIGGGIKGAAKLAGRGIAAAGRSLLPIASTALKLAGRAALTLATGPVGWIVAAGTAIYAGYKLYKYLTRNDIKDDLSGKLTRLRLLMYGFNDVKKEYYYKIFDLEMLMKDYVKYKNYRVSIEQPDSDDVNKVLEIFNVTREEKDKYKILNTWYTNRFIPAYKSFMQALYNVNNSIYLDEIDKLKPMDVFNLASRITIPTSIYNIEEIPTFEDIKVYVTKDDVDSMLTNIINECKEKTGQNDTDAIKKIREENKEKQAEIAKKQQIAQEQSKREQIITQNNQQSNQQSNQSSFTQDNQSSAIQKPSEQPPFIQKPSEQPPFIQKPSEQYLINKNINNTNTTNTENKNVTINKDTNDADSPYTGSKDSKSTEDKPKTKISSKLVRASGPLYPGSSSLEGINSVVKEEKIYKLDPNVFQLFTGMAKEYYELTGKKIRVQEAFRSYEDQARLYKKYPGKAAKPGNSTHEFGLAIDISSKEADELDKLGLMRKYGFTRPIGGEKWHIEPIGVSINPTLSKKDKDFRFNAIQASVLRGGDGYGTLNNSIKKKRNIPYQISIYKKEDDNTIDLREEVKFSYIDSKIKSSIDNKSSNTADEKIKITDVASSNATKQNNIIKTSTADKSNNSLGTSNNTTNNPVIDNKSFVDTLIKFSKTDFPKITGLNEDFYKLNLKQYTPYKPINTEQPSQQKAANIQQASVYKAINTEQYSPYRVINTVSQTSTQPQAPIAQYNIVVDTKNLEKVMYEQLDILKLIAKILTSIDDKFDINLFKQFINKPQQAIVTVDKSIPKDSINLSRKAIY